MLSARRCTHICTGPSWLRSPPFGWSTMCMFWFLARGGCQPIWRQYCKSALADRDRQSGWTSPYGQVTMVPTMRGPFTCRLPKTSPQRSQYNCLSLSLDRIRAGCLLSGARSSPWPSPKRGCYERHILERGCAKWHSPIKEAPPNGV